MTERRREMRQRVIYGGAIAFDNHRSTVECAVRDFSPNGNFCGGQAVFHLHMHVMPRSAGVALLPPMSNKESPKVLEDNATRLIAALAAG